MNRTEYNKQYYLKNKDKQIKYRHEHRDVYKEYYRRAKEVRKLRYSYEEIREQENRAKSKYRAKLKLGSLTHYGKGACACVICGEARIDCLSIDHINDDGAKHRRELKKQKGGSWVIYAWLKRNNYPEGYQTLCMNCQTIKEATRRRRENQKGQRN